MTISPNTRDLLRQPPREFSLLPFWFWNDELTEDEIRRQIADFDAHGVYGFVIHPRVGLPRSIGWMSERMMHFIRCAVEEAAARKMQVVLYDEGMYPSGSSSGQVVAEDPRFAVRGLARVELASGEELMLSPGQNCVTMAETPEGQQIAIVDRAIDSGIRGLHYIGEGPQEETPPAADLLNPDAVACFLRLVYDKFAAAVGEHFGTTIVGIFTDEPHLLGRNRERDIQPGTTDILEQVERILGYDFTPYLPTLWNDTLPGAARYRADYDRAVHVRLEETYYRQLSDWCRAHGTQLMGHPAGPMDLGLERYFQIPGQDLVWRWVLPNTPSALTGPESTQAKCSSSAMLHLGRRRNSNEFCGAYGHELTYEEMKWLADWCFIRGVNMLFPHAFYYSVRGVRVDERPPDVGPNSPWWPEYRRFADYCRRLCWLNTESEHVCRIAILGEANRLPWSAAEVCFTHQKDFNYLEIRDLWETAIVDGTGISIAGMHYDALIIDDLPSVPPEAESALATLAGAGRLISWEANGDTAAMLAALDTLAPAGLIVTPACPGLRCRQVRKGGVEFSLFFNEGASPIAFDVSKPPTEAFQVDLVTGDLETIDTAATICLKPYEMIAWANPL